MADFVFPLNLKRLENSRMRLVPLDHNLKEWARLSVEDGLTNPQVYDWLVHGPFASAEEYVAWYDADVRPSKGTLLLAIILKAGTLTRKEPITGEESHEAVVEGTFAGVSGIIGQPERATADLGQMLLTPFQRTFVGTHANGLLLQHCLDEPADGGLGLRRVQWQANADNTASVKAAKRLGFKWEGLMRWHQVLPEGKNGHLVSATGRGPGAGRHTALLSICWDDWAEGGANLQVARLLAR